MSHRNVDDTPLWRDPVIQVVVLFLLVSVFIGVLGFYSVASP